jgi:hypothetical protein
LSSDGTRRDNDDKNNNNTRWELIKKW